MTLTAVSTTVLYCDHRKLPTVGQAHYKVYIQKSTDLSMSDILQRHVTRTILSTNTKNLRRFITV